MSKQGSHKKKKRQVGSASCPQRVVAVNRQQKHTQQGRRAACSSQHHPRVQRL